MKTKEQVDTITVGDLLQYINETEDKEEYPLCVRYKGTLYRMLDVDYDDEINLDNYVPVENEYYEPVEGEALFERIFKENIMKDALNEELILVDLFGEDDDDEDTLDYEGSNLSTSDKIVLEKKFKDINHKLDKIIEDIYD